MQKIEVECADDVKAVDQFCASMAETTQEELGARVAMTVSRDQSKIAACALSVKGKSLDEFIRIVISDPNTIGFKPEVFRLTNEEWSALYSYLAKINKKS